MQLLSTAATFRKHMRKKNTEILIRKEMVNKSDIYTDAC